MPRPAIPTSALDAAYKVLKYHYPSRARVAQALAAALAAMSDTSSKTRDTGGPVGTTHHDHGHHTGQGGGGGAPPPPPPPPVQTPTSVGVTPQTLSGVEGSVSQRITATILDQAGAVIVGLAPTGWTSTDPTIASVDPTGLVSFLVAGVVTVRAHYNTIDSAPVGVTVTLKVPDTTPPPPPPPPGPNFLRHDFEDGTLGPFGIAGVQGIVSVVADPTPRASGKVCKIHYENFPEGGNFDCNQAIAPTDANNPGRKLGEELWARWKFYCDTDGTEPAIRKFCYWGWSNAGWGFPHAFNLVIASANSVQAPIPPGTPIQFLVSAHCNRSDGTQLGSFGAQGNAGPATWYGPMISLKAWHELKVQLIPDTAFGAADGVLRIWFDGVLIFESTTMQFTSPDWLDDPATYQWVDYRVGQQLNGSAKLIEDRYLDDVSFAATEAGL